jgi:outer membrane protein assembly factor BamA
MSGSLRVMPADSPPFAHDHVDLMLDSGRCLRFNDPRPAHFQEAQFHLDGTYDRANQVTLVCGLRYGDRASLHPDLTLRGGYAWGRERWLYDVGVTQPIVGERLFAVGATAYRRNANADEERVGTTENTLAARFFREDWRDYFETEGIAAHATLTPASHVDLSVAWQEEEHRSVSKTTDWGLFGGDKRMRANLPIDDGTLRGLTLSCDVDTRNHDRNPTRGTWLRGSYGWTGGGLGGDYEFRKGTVDLRRYMKLSRGRYFDVRLAGGALDKARRGAGDEPVLGYDAAPVQERFYLGGTGTMRATQFKSIVGDRMVLMNAEMRVNVFDDLQAVVFADVGDAWIEDTESADLHTDAGIGFQDSDSSFRINVAKKLDRESDEGVFVSARIQRMF